MISFNFIKAILKNPPYGHCMLNFKSQVVSVYPAMCMSECLMHNYAGYTCFLSHSHFPSLSHSHFPSLSPSLTLFNSLSLMWHNMGRHVQFVHMQVISLSLFSSLSLTEMKKEAITTSGPLVMTARSYSSSHTVFW